MQKWDIDKKDIKVESALPAFVPQSAFCRNCIVWTLKNLSKHTKNSAKKELVIQKMNQII